MTSGLFAGQLTIRDDGEIFSCDISPNGKQRKIFTMRTPLLGVISAITPFNHPLNMVSHKLAPAIATNNRIVLKPTELTPLTALTLADILYDAGLPPEMLSVVTGSPGDDGRCDGHRSRRRPHHLHWRRARRQNTSRPSAGYKRTVLELGGNDPLIVMDDDADLDKAAELAVQGSTKNSGQRCTAVKRILVVESVADSFVRCVLEKAKKIRCGDPMDPTTDVGTVDPRARRAALRAPRERCGRRRRRASARQRPQGSALSADGRRQVPYRTRTGVRGDLRPRHPDHPRSERHRRGHPHLEFDRLSACRPASARTGSTASRASSTGSRSAP